jgi:hypothetical protein
MSWLRSHLSGRPFLVERDDLPGMRALVSRLSKDQAFDAIHADQLTMAQFALSQDRQDGIQPLRVFDATMLPGRLSNGCARHFPRLSFFRPLLSLEAGR